MHLPDHFLDPATMTATALFSGGAVAYSLFRVRKEAATKVLPAAAVGAGIFAAQLVNYPIAGETSGHLVGGALAGMLLGPWAGLLAMSAVLAVQAVVFGDGGILALGANILNMGVIGVAVGVMVDRLFNSQRSQAATNLATRASAAALAGYLCVVAAALACAVEMAASGAALAGEVVPAMLGVHAVIGLAESAISAVAITACAYFVAHWSRRALAHDHKALGTICTLAAVIAVVLAPFASRLPDGLESVAARLGSLSLQGTATIPPVLADYSIPGIGWSSAATALAGVLGIALVYGITALACIGVRRPL